MYTIVRCWSTLTRFRWFRGPDSIAEFIQLTDKYFYSISCYVWTYLERLCDVSNIVPGTAKVFVNTWGCAHNSSDSEYMAGQLAAQVHNRQGFTGCILIQKSCKIIHRRRKIITHLTRNFYIILLRFFGFPLFLPFSNSRPPFSPFWLLDRVHLNYYTVHSTHLHYYTVHSTHLHYYPRATLSPRTRLRLTCGCWTPVPSRTRPRNTSRTRSTRDWVLTRRSWSQAVFLRLVNLIDLFFFFNCIYLVIHLTNNLSSSDVDPDWLYPDPDPGS